MEKRNPSLDVCRIAAMIGIVTTHVIFTGKVQQPDIFSGSAADWLVFLLYIAARCSVDIFGLLSGYLGFRKKKETCRRAVELCGIMFFYSLIITIAFAALRPDAVHGIKGIVKGLFPPLVGKYWYIVCYLPVMFLQPFLNHALSALPENRHKALVLVGFVLLSVLPSVTTVDFFVIDKGFSFIWLLYLYVFGAYIRRAEDSGSLSKLRLPALFFCIGAAALLLGNMLIFRLTGKNHNYMTEYSSPVILLMDVCAFSFFRSLRIRKGEKLFAIAAATAFDVYMIHNHIYCNDLLLEGAFAWVRSLPFAAIAPVTVACAVLLFAALTVIARTRVFLFRICRLDSLFTRIAEKIDRVIYPA